MLEAHEQRRVGIVGLLADGERLLAADGGLLPAAAEQRQAGPPQRDVPAVVREPERVGVLGVGVDLGGRGPSPGGKKLAWLLRGRSTLLALCLKRAGLRALQRRL